MRASVLLSTRGLRWFEASAARIAIALASPYGSLKSAFWAARRQVRGKARPHTTQGGSMNVKALCALAACVGAALLAAQAAAGSPRAVVWVQTNEPTGNHV